MGRVQAIPSAESDLTCILVVLFGLQTSPSRPHGVPSLVTTSLSGPKASTFRKGRTTHTVSFEAAKKFVD
jgi:hypothetical protein